MGAAAAAVPAVQAAALVLAGGGWLLRLPQREPQCRVVRCAGQRQVGR
jgi:hypothetical protein